MAMPPTRSGREEAERKRQKQNEWFNITGLALALGSWGYSVMNPDPNFWLGSVLLLTAAILLTVGACRIFELSDGVCFCVFLLTIAGVAWFDYKVWYEPHRDKQ